MSSERAALKTSCCRASLARLLSSTHPIPSHPAAQGPRRPLPAGPQAPAGLPGAAGAGLGAAAVVGRGAAAAVAAGARGVHAAAGPAVRRHAQPRSVRVPAGGGPHERRHLVRQAADGAAADVSGAEGAQAGCRMVPVACRLAPAAVLLMLLPCLPSPAAALTPWAACRRRPTTRRWRSSRASSPATSCWQSGATPPVRETAGRSR